MSTTSRKQERNSHNRAQVLGYWECMKNKQLTFHMRNGVCVEAVLICTKGDGNRLLVKGLQTPIGEYNHAILRKEDIAYIE